MSKTLNFKESCRLSKKKKKIRISVTIKIISKYRVSSYISKIKKWPANVPAVVFYVQQEKYFYRTYKCFYGPGLYTCVRVFLTTKNLLVRVTNSMTRKIDNIRFSCLGHKTFDLVKSVTKYSVNARIERISNRTNVAITSTFYFNM